MTSFKSSVRRLGSLVFGVVAVVLLAFADTSAEAASEPYVAINPPQATADSGKIEVLEFFQYGCPHCRAMAPLVAKWQPNLGDDVMLIRIPVAFNPSMSSWQYLYYTLEAMNRLDLHPKVFATVQTERNPLATRDAVVEWAVKQGLDKVQFESVYDSFGVRTKVNRANQLIKTYNIESVPTIIVNGSYITSPALANGYSQSLDVASSLIERVRNERKKAG